MSTRRDAEIADTLPAEEAFVVEASAGQARAAADDEPAATAMPAGDRIALADTLPPEDRPAITHPAPPEDQVALEATLPPEDGNERGPRPPEATLPPGDEPASPPSADDPPVSGWDRYELLALLGRGGMGAVYKARDRRLGRILAIKFILGADPTLTLRFLQEARAQSSIDHPNVCRVYEAGHVQGRAYIALQFVDGEPLHKAAAAMSLDQKIAVVRDVAVAIQEAHRLGIVHRDLKPGNVMVERTEDGRWVPIVMDFGLARETTTDAGITESGIPLGTPAYMSPEQARGDVHAIDRRSDIYSLGATLYELLTGSVPFPAASLATALGRAIHDDAPALRSLVPSLPIDLETITLKCLAKEPVQRYPSARALADDLGRYLDGEPILGRRVPLWQRVRRRARRHRALVILGASSLAAIIVVAALGIRAWLSSAERARLAEQLSRAASEIEVELRAAYLSPLHDTRPDRAQARERMRAIAATHHDLGELGDGIIHNALGRGHLALHEWREAAEELERAAAAGLQSPGLHAAHGRALGELYHRAFEEARRAGDKAWLARRQRELEQRYLAPAVTELSHLDRTAPGKDAALLEAMIALYRGDFAAGERLAHAVAEHEPGSSDARKLGADAAYAAAVDAFDHGDYNAALPRLERATALYADASDVARSDQSLYEAAAQAWLQRAEIDARQGRSPRVPLDHALDAIERALRADPEDAPAYTTKAYVLLRWYRTTSLMARDDERPPLLDRVADAAARAVAIDPRDAHAWTALGNAHVYRGRYEAYHGGEPVAWLSRAFEELGKALAIQPDDPRANNDLGTAHRWLGTILDESGRDPMPDYEAALRSYERVAALDPQYLPACLNQIDIHTAIAEHRDAIGADPRNAVASAQRAGERCLAIDPSYHLALDAQAQAQLALAHYLAEAGGDPGEALASARGYLARSEQLLPAHMEVWFHRLVGARIEATAAVRRGADPASALAAGRAAFAQVLRLLPDSAYTYVEAARLDLLEAAWAARAGNRSMSLLAAARDHAEKAIALNDRLADAKLTAAEACLQIVAAQPSRAVIDQGKTYVDQAIALNPRLPRAQLVRDALVQLHAP